MTRINVIPVEDLHYQHLVAEYRELPRVFGLAYRAISAEREFFMPEDYTFGKGHMTFFYNKLMFLARRQDALVLEMIHRGYKPNFVDSLHKKWKSKIPRQYWGEYTPTKKAVRLNLERINKRLSGDRT